MNLAENYATALFQTRTTGAKADTRAILKNLVSALERRGHLKLLPRITAEYEKLELRASRRRPKIALARESEKPKAVAQAREFLEDGTEVEVCLDPSLVSGFVVSGPDFRFDASGRRSLIELYQQLTRHDLQSK